MLKTNFFNLIITHNIKKALKITAVFIKAAKKHVSVLKHYINNASCNNDNKENSNENIIKVIQSKVKATV
jgi:hypothetical protein